MVDLSARRFELLDPLDFAADPFELVDLLAVPLEPVALVAVRFDPLELRAVLFAVVDVVELRFVGVVLAGVLSVPAAASPADPVDRKSTRLNSSHVAISYAVFCLKKKKQ